MALAMTAPPKRACIANAIDTPIYTLELPPDLRAVVQADPSPLHPDPMAFLATSNSTPYWRHTYEYRPEMAAALFEGRAASTHLYTDEHGAWISAYAPLFDAEQRVVALLEVDAPQGQLFAQVTSHAYEELKYALI